MSNPIGLSAAVVAAGCLFAASVGAPSRAPVAASAPASAVATDVDDDALAFFWESFQRVPRLRDEALARLGARALAADATNREVLTTGLAHLWCLAEGGGEPLERHGHAVLAEHWLGRAAAADPDDTRIAGWRASAAKAIADLEHDAAGQAAAVARLQELAASDPCFHSVPLAIATFELPRTDARFVAALDAMNAAFACGDERAGQDHPRWPHNVAAFLVALADCRLKAGDVAGAELALVVAEARASTARWPHHQLVDERLATLPRRAALYADDDLSNDPPFALQGGVLSCSACHAASSADGPEQR
jgi:hypothetical protein